jgi:hypothetical protein
MNDNTRWNWIVRGLQGNIAMLEALAQEGGYVETNAFEELGKCQMTLSNLIQSLSARPEIRQAVSTDTSLQSRSQPENGSGERSARGLIGSGLKSALLQLLSDLPFEIVKLLRDRLFRKQPEESPEEFKSSMATLERSLLESETESNLNSTRPSDSQQ